MTAADLTAAELARAWFVCILGACIALWLIAEVRAWWKRRRDRRFTVRSIDPSCERAGSQASLTRILRGGVR